MKGSQVRFLQITESVQYFLPFLGPERGQEINDFSFAHAASLRQGMPKDKHSGRSPWTTRFQTCGMVPWWPPIKVPWPEISPGRTTSAANTTFSWAPFDLSLAFAAKSVSILAADTCPSDSTPIISAGVTPGWRSSTPYRAAPRQRRGGPWSGRPWGSQGLASAKTAHGLIEFLLSHVLSWHWLSTPGPCRCPNQPGGLARAPLPESCGAGLPL
jgi:hypothetical protein